ncbi:unnamed protein product [Rotaria sp. Silwood2]|nr:unnamed protein product [Rotaria sp. Silwood2]
MAGSVRSGRELLEIGQLLPGHLLTGAGEDEGDGFKYQPCDQLIKQTCLSHGTKREVLCTNETGGTKTFTCGHHKCTKTCHDGPCPDCLLLPENCKTCACGKTIMDNQQRSSCIDPLPTCEKLCARILSCGSIDDRHQCLAHCHNGPCPSCSTQLILQCRCGQSSKSTSCSCDRLVKDIVCNVKSNEGKDDADLTQSLVRALSVRTIDLTLARKQQPQQQELECDERRIIQQDENLAQALSINLNERRPSPIVYTNFLRDYARRNLELVQAIERKFSLLVTLTEYHGHPTRHHHGLKLYFSLKPMHVDEDRLIHTLANFYGLETQQVN